jgi:hypothetical protein
MSLMTTGYLGLIAAFYCRAPLQFASRLLTDGAAAGTILRGLAAAARW